MTLQKFGFTIKYIKGRDNSIGYKLSRPGSLYVTTTEEPRIVLDRDSAIKKFRLIQIDLGHLSSEITHEFASKELRFKGLFSICQEISKQCNICMKFNLNKLKLHTFRTKLESPFRKIGIDIVGSLPTMKNGNIYIIEASEYLTRWAECKAIKLKTSKNDATFLLGIMFKHGAPEELLTDLGKEFLNGVIKKLCEIVDTKKTYTAAFNPKCNGTAERVNQTLIAKLAKMCNENWHEWDEYLPYALFAYRVSPRKLS